MPVCNLNLNDPEGLEKLVCECRKPSICIDSRLTCWENWMKERKRVHSVLGKRLGRLPGDLVMNTIDELSRVNEDRTVMNYTKILAPPDPQRGRPSFWSAPAAVAKCLYPVPTPEQRCEVPEIHHVRVPPEIAAEKDILPRNRDSYKLWVNSKYRQLRVNQVSERLHQIEPHRPDSRGLIIMGKSAPVEFEQPVKDVSHHEFTHHKIKSSVSSQAMSQGSPGDGRSQTSEREVSCPLVMNGEAVNVDQAIRKARTYLIVFSFNTKSDKVATEYLKFENRAPFSVTLIWEKFEAHQLFKDIIPERNDHYFYFDKNLFVLLPNQTIEFPFWFKTDKIGTYSETWKIVTSPQLWPASIKILVHLKAVAVMKGLSKQCEIISTKLSNTVRDNLIKEALDTVLSHACADKQDPTVYSFGIAKVFESINSKDDPYYDKPLYTYNREIVDKLVTIYEQVKPQAECEEEEEEQQWNYSLDELRILIMKHELTYKLSAEELRSDSKTKQSETKDEPKIPLSEQFEELVRQLKTPSIWINREKETYEKVYSILCSYFSKIDIQLVECEEMLGVNKNVISYPTTIPFVPGNESERRLLYQRFDETYFDRVMLQQGPRKYIHDQKPTPLRLRDIPPENCLERYNAYHNIFPELEQTEKADGKKKKKGKKDKKDKDKKGGKGDKSEKKGSKKGKKETASSKKGDKGKKSQKDKSAEKQPPVIDDGYVVNEDFDPFFEEEVEEPPQFSEGKDVEMNESFLNEFFDIPYTVLEQYHLNMYIIFYSNLCDAACAIEETLEMVKDTHVTHRTVQRLEECRKWKTKESKSKVLDIKNVLGEILREAGFQKPKKRFTAYQVSEDSLENLLKPYGKAGKPISYPEEFFQPHLLLRRGEMVNKSTVSLGGGILDQTWEDYKPVSGQTSIADSNDIVADVEFPVSETSVERLHLKESKSCQKNYEDRGSDEEDFYLSGRGSDSDDDV